MGLTLGVFGATDASGWTTPTLPAGATAWYVDNTGSDSNDGLTPSTPFATIAKAITAVVSGRGDWVLIRRGQTFTGNSLSMFGSGGQINKTGLDANNLLLFMGYTTTGWSAGNPRGDVTSNESNPLILWTDGGNAQLIYGGSDYAMDYWGFIGVDFQCTTNGRKNTILTAMAQHKLFFEDCGFTYGGIQLAPVNLSSFINGDLTMRRCATSRVWGSNIEGLLTNTWLSVLFEENVWYKCGDWASETTRTNPTSSTWHNVYGNYRGNSDYTTGESWTYSCNISAYADMTGLRQRQGGTIYNNYLAGNNNDIDWGTTEGISVWNATAPRLCSYNVIVESFGNGDNFRTASPTGYITPRHTWTYRYNLGANMNTPGGQFISWAGGTDGGDGLGGLNCGVDADATNQCLNYPGNPNSFATNHPTGNDYTLPVMDLTGKDYNNMRTSAYATHLHSLDPVKYSFTDEAGFWTAVLAMRRYNYDVNFHANTINNWMRAKALMPQVSIADAHRGGRSLRKF